MPLSHWLLGQDYRSYSSLHTCTTLFDSLHTCTTLYDSLHTCATLIDSLLLCTTRFTVCTTALPVFTVCTTALQSWTVCPTALSSLAVCTTKMLFFGCLRLMQFVQLMFSSLPVCTNPVVLFGSCPTYLIATLWQFAWKLVPSRFCFMIHVDWGAIKLAEPSCNRFNMLTTDRTTTIQ